MLRAAATHDALGKAGVDIEQALWSRHLAATSSRSR
jgi:hypothetical protein